MTLSVAGNKLVGDPEVEDHRAVGYYANNQSDWRAPSADDVVEPDALMELFAATDDAEPS